MVPIYIIAATAVALIAILAWLWRKNRSELHRITAWTAILSGFASPIIACWGLVHLKELRARSYFDYGFERHAASIAFVAIFPALIWAIRSRRWYSLIALVLSIIQLSQWVLICGTL